MCSCVYQIFSKFPYELQNRVMPLKTKARSLQIKTMFFQTKMTSLNTRTTSLQTRMRSLKTKTRFLQTTITSLQCHCALRQPLLKVWKKGIQGSDGDSSFLLLFQSRRQQSLTLKEKGNSQFKAGSE